MEFLVFRYPWASHLGGKRFEQADAVRPPDGSLETMGPEKVLVASQYVGRTDRAPTSRSAVVCMSSRLTQRAES